MALSEFAEKYSRSVSGSPQSDLSATDPDFAELFTNFIHDEVINDQPLDNRTRYIAILSALLGCGAKELYADAVLTALNFGVTPVEIKEILYQSVAYLGYARVYPFFELCSNAIAEAGMKLPIESRSTTNSATRLEAGVMAQVDIFGEYMKDFYKTGDPLTVHINRWLADNCFGDYYTRDGLDYGRREMITFCFLAAKGGCESQLASHCKANIRVGNTKEFLVSVISNIMPYIGYPATLNAVKVICEAEEE